MKSRTTHNHEQYPTPVVITIAALTHVVAFRLEGPQRIQQTRVKASNAGPLDGLLVATTAALTDITPGILGHITRARNAYYDSMQPLIERTDRIREKLDVTIRTSSADVFEGLEYLIEADIAEELSGVCRDLSKQLRRFEVRVELLPEHGSEASSLTEWLELVSSVWTDASTGASEPSNLPVPTQKQVGRERHPVRGARCAPCPLEELSRRLPWRDLRRWQQGCLSTRPFELTGAATEMGAEALEVSERTR